MASLTDSAGDMSGKPAKSGKLDATHLDALFECKLLKELVDLEGFEPSTS